MKKIILLFLLFLVCGCSVDYDLEISNNSFKENINIKILKSQIPDSSSVNGVEIDDQITPFINEQTPAFFGIQDRFYHKKVNEQDDYYDINLNYKYTFEEFKHAYSINSCFENIEISGEDIYYIKLKGMFYCLYSDSVDIKIKTNNDVINHNADKVDGNTYIWYIHNGNQNNVDILFEVSKDIKNKSVILEITIIVVLLIISGIVFKVLKKKNKQSNSFE